MTKEFNEIVKDAIKDSAISQAKFARKLGISPVTVWRWATGKSKPEGRLINFWINKIKEAVK